MSGPCRRWRPASVTDEERARARVVATLVERFPAIDPATVATHVSDAWESLADARVRDFVPTLVVREVDQSLRHQDVARATGSHPAAC